MIEENNFNDNNLIFDYNVFDDNNIFNNIENTYNPFFGLGSYKPPNPPNPPPIPCF